MRLQVKVLFGLVAVACAILLLNLVSTVKPIKKNKTDVARPHGFLKEGTETPEAWEKCLNETHEFNRDVILKPPAYPRGDPHKVKACIVALAQKNLKDTITQLEALDRHFVQLFVYPLFVFHLGLNEKERKSIENSVRSRVVFVKLDKQDADRRRKDEQRGYEPFRTYFSLDVFSHSALEDFDYVMRVDGVVLKETVNFDPFVFMENNGKVLAVSHWSSDSKDICDGILRTADTYKRVFYRFVGYHRDRELPNSCYGAGAGIFFAYAPFFRSVQVRSYWNYARCLDGVKTDGWTDQQLLPLTVSMIADEPEKRYQYFTNYVASDFGNKLLEPHASWGSPAWPVRSPDDKDVTVGINTSMTMFNRGCLVYYVSVADIQDMRRSLANLEFHFLWRYPYPIVIFHNGLSEADKAQITVGLDPRIVIPQYHVVTEGRQAFFLSRFFEHEALLHFAYFMVLDPKTNLVASLTHDPFKFMEENRFHLAYHRTKAPDGVSKSLDPEANGEIWGIASSQQDKLGSPYKERKLTPKKFGLSLQHWTMGSFSFFRSSECLNFMKGLPATAHINHAYPLAVSLFEDNPWQKVADLSSLQLNWKSKLPIPFSQNAWQSKEEAAWPTWPFKYSNRNPLC